MPDDDDARVPAVDDGCEDPVELRRRLEALQLENAVMRETINVLKAGDPRLDPSGLTSREKARVVDAVRGEFGLADALSAVGLRRSTYYYGRTAMRAVDKYAVLRERVRLLFEEGGRVWGYHHPRHAAAGPGGSAGRLGEGRAPRHAGGGAQARIPEETEAVELLRG